MQVLSLFLNLPKNFIIAQNELVLHVIMNDIIFAQENMFPYVTMSRQTFFVKRCTLGGQATFSVI